MAFNFSELLQNPNFQAGLGMFGASLPNNRGAGLVQGMQMMQQMQLAKQKKAMQQAELEQQAARTAVYQQQVEQAAQGQAMQKLAMERGMAMIEQARAGRNGVMQQPQQQESQQQITEQLPDIQNYYRQRIKPIESNNRQWDDKGQPLLGPVIPGRVERAVGGGQIMPSTGPEAAKLAGLKWDETLFNRPKTGIPEIDQETEAYNDKLGEAYLNKQIQDFGGNVAFGSAAYNAGPDRTRKAIKVAEDMKRPELWLSFLPPETRNYVAKTAGQPQQKPAQQPLPPKGPLGVTSQPARPDLDILEGAAVMGLSTGDIKPLTELGKAYKPETYKPGDVVASPGGKLQQIPNPITPQQAAENEFRRRSLELEEQRTRATVAGQEATTKEKEKELMAQKAKDKAAFDMVSGASDRLISDINELTRSPGLASITGGSAITNPIALPGGHAYTSLAKLRGIKSKLVNDTLQAVRQASANGASGYGSFTEKELGVVETYVANLDPGSRTFKDDLQKILKYAEDIKSRSKNLYEESTGSSLTRGLPQGSKQIGTSGGKKVYQLPDGSQVIER